MGTIIKMEKHTSIQSVLKKKEQTLKISSMGMKMLKNWNMVIYQFYPLKGSIK